MLLAAKVENRDNIGENIRGVFGIAVYESLFRFDVQDGGFKMAAAKMKDRDNFGEILNFGGFRVSRAG